MNDYQIYKKKVEISQKERLGKVIFWIIIITFLIVGTITTVNALQWANKHFPGFLINERMRVAPVGQYHWSGILAGLKYPDKIISANGTEVSSKAEMEAVVEKHYLGVPIIWELERAGTRFSVSVQTMQYTWTDLFMTYGTTLIAGIVFMLIGTVVFIMKPNIMVSWSLLIACTFLSLWSITIFDIQSTHFGFIRLYMIANTFTGAAFVHFSLYFPEPREFIKKYPWIPFIPWVIGIAIAVPLITIYPNIKYQIFQMAANAYLIVAAIAVLYPLFKTYFRPTSVLARQRSKVVLFGAALAFPVPAIAYFAQLVFGSFLGMRIQTHLLTLPMIIFPASIAFAIARHNLFDVDVYIKRAVGYVIMTAIVVGGYLGVSIPLNVLLGQYEIAQSRAFPILFTLLVILIFNPLYQRVQSIVDRVFFRKEYDYGAIVDKVSNAITSMLDLPSILKELVTTFTKDLFIDTSSVMLITPEGAQFKVFMADGDDQQRVENVNIDRKAPVVEIIEQEKAELTKFDVLEDPKYKDVSKGCAADFEALNASLMVPLIYQDNVIGLLNLGEKKSGKFYTREDVNLIKTLASQGAVAIENARMVGEVIEKERMEEELNIARDLQVSMLPSECPQMENFEIAAFSVSAREVGGDFYDFIEMDEEKAGFVIGDVTGKSVSGALVMSASRSVFRMLSESELTVAESMIRANRRLKKDVKTGMFVALLYAVMNSQDKTLTMCSAGQTQPVHLSVKSGRATLVETEGDTFPLGILDDANYEETRLHLEAGDKAIFYTDGIVEAMNAEEEMFGFERLLEIVQKSQSTTADELLKEIVNKVKVFTGDAPQHDDLTVIVVSAK
jgi:sigma-B regulation protein RsbU (phosphoserine phosphatase)